MTTTIRLTMAQALVRFLGAQRTLVDGEELPLFGGVFAIFGHGNVAGLGEALENMSEALPTLRAHNEQAMGHAAIAYAKAWGRRRMMACTTSIGPGATNLVTAAATAHVNRLPLLLLPGDVFMSRLPDPVLQQLEAFDDGTATVNDCLRPVSRYFDRIVRPEQLLRALPRALQVLTDPADCGPVTLALPQDVQAEAFDVPLSFFEPHIHSLRRLRPDRRELERAVELIATSSRPLLVAGGGVHYSQACEALQQFAHRHGIPVAETQAGKGALRWDDPSAVGGLGVTGTGAANALAAEADLVLAVGTRLQDFTTASWSLFHDPGVRLVSLNAAAFDASKHGALAVQGDAREGLTSLSQRLDAWHSDPAWQQRIVDEARRWSAVVDRVCAPPQSGLPSDAQVLGAVHRAAGDDDVVVCASGGLPGELHKLWRARGPGTYHLEYGYSCMGYEIAGGLGVKLARPEAEVFVLVGDGSYLMLNSEIATSVMLGLKLTIVVVDNHGFGCINRLQHGVGSGPFRNLWADSGGEAPVIDFAAHARSLGAQAQKVDDIAGLEQALASARTSDHTTVIVIDADPRISTGEGGAWWEVAVAEVSERTSVREARQKYVQDKRRQRW
ncbi:MAG: 3D-(3,5/4)-trihydroxycyclohexane-1,2-dione acylhydrolase (decyclizing) [Pseudomonadota bacterium]